MDKNLINLLEKNSPDQGITFIKNYDTDFFISYAELYENALYLLYNLQSKGIRPGAEIIFQLTDNKDFLTLFWACLLGKLIPIPLTVGNNYDHKLKFFKIWKKIKNPYLICNQSILNYYNNFVENENLDLIWKQVNQKLILFNELSEKIKPGKRESIEPHQIAFIQFSSGSTGDPKGVILTHQNVIVNIQAILECARVTQKDSTLNWLPLTHDMGLIGFHLGSAMAKINQFIMPTSLFIRHPNLWLSIASQHQVTLLSSPNFGLKYFLTRFNEKTTVKWNLSPVRLIFNGAEPISIKICQRFLKRLAAYGLKNNVMFPVYGMAEASLAISFPPLETEIITYYLDRNSINQGDRIILTAKEDKNSVPFVDVGYPISNCQVKIANARGNELAEKKIGIVYIKGKNVTIGYYNNKKATKAALGSDGWLNTGDLGFMYHNRLTIIGRLKDLIFANGQNYYSHDLERIAEKIEKIELGKIAAIGVFNHKTQEDDVVLFLVYKGKKGTEYDCLEKQLIKCIFVYTGIKISRVIGLKKIPKTTSGKIKRYLLKDNYLKGEYSE